MFAEGSIHAAIIVGPINTIIKEEVPRKLVMLQNIVELIRE